MEIFFRQFVELPAKNQPLLDYFWDINRDWKRLQRTTTLHGRLYTYIQLTKGCNHCSEFRPNSVQWLPPLSI